MMKKIRIIFIIYVNITEVRLVIMVGKNAGTKNMENETEIKISIENIKGEIKLIYQKIEMLETNHFPHIEKEIAKLNKVAWVVGFMVFSQLVYALRSIIL